MTTHRLWELARTFPSLASGLDRFPVDDTTDFEWDAFVAWAQGAWVTGGGMRSIRFIAHVWTGCVVDVDERIGPFNLVDAMGVWDLAHRRAFLEWAASPWWC